MRKSTSNDQLSSSSNQLNPLRRAASGDLMESPSKTQEKSRLRKQKGFLELGIQIEEDGQVISFEKRKYFFELVGGYLRWFAEESSNSNQVISFSFF